MQVYVCACVIHCVSTPAFLVSIHSCTCATGARYALVASMCRAHHSSPCHSAHELVVSPYWPCAVQTAITALSLVFLAWGGGNQEGGNQEEDQQCLLLQKAHSGVLLSLRSLANLRHWPALQSWTNKEQKKDQGQQEENKQFKARPLPK